MDGITVLRSYEQVIDNIPGWTWAGLFVVICALICFIGSICLMRRRFSKISIWGPLLCCSITLAIGAAVLFIDAQPVYETRYDTYIHGTVDMTEFANRYEILEQDGLLFTIRKK